MPGYLVNPLLDSRAITVLATGDISATNLQDALAEIASEKATVLSVTTVQNNLNTTNTMYPVGRKGPEVKFDLSAQSAAKNRRVLLRMLGTPPRYGHS